MNEQQTVLAVNAKGFQRIPPAGSCIAGHTQCPLASDVARTAVKEVFAILGVNVDDPEKVEQFRENLRFGATMRRAADKAMLALVAVFATAIAAATWVGIAAKITGAG